MSPILDTGLSSERRLWPTHADCDFPSHCSVIILHNFAISILALKINKEW